MNTEKDNALQNATRAGKAWIETRASIEDTLRRSVRSCINCERFDEPNEVCNKWNARPPARIIALGCDDHVDEIPF